MLSACAHVSSHVFQWLADMWLGLWDSPPLYPLALCVLFGCAPCHVAARPGRLRSLDPILCPQRAQRSWGGSGGGAGGSSHPPLWRPIPSISLSAALRFPRWEGDRGWPGLSSFLVTDKGRHK